ncbi:MAG TPA: TonB-dependent receptor [Caulobacter sp.]|nr:TonB-dependent receptor [Caulobacter sp.]
MSYRRQALLAAAGLSVLLAPAAFAQEAPAQPGATDVGEVIVTTRRRDEALEDVPAAVSAITAADRETLALENLDDYLRQAPSATLIASGPEYLNDVSIRGQGGGRLGFSETATGLFRNGMFVAGGGFGGRSLSRLDFFDAQRVEIMRGPQGALFGRNSVGGAVNVVTQHPLDAFSARGLLRAQDPDHLAIEGVVNFPFADGRAAVRIGGFAQDQEGGEVRNLTTGNYLDTQRYQGLRTALRWTLSDSLTIDLMYEGSHSEAPAFGTLGRRPLRADGTVLDPSPDLRADMNREGGAVIDDDAVFLTAAWDLGFADLSVRAGYKRREGGRSGEDNDHFAGQTGIDVTPGADTRGPDYTIGQFEDFSRTGVQAYLASQGEGRLTWLIGVEHLESSSVVDLDPSLCPTYTGTAQPATAGCYIGASGTLTGVPNQVRNAARLGLNHDLFDESLESPSLFGAVEYALTDSTRLGLEARVQTDRKTFRLRRWSEDPLVYFGPGPVPAGMMAPITVDPDGAGGPLPASPVQYCPPTLTGCSASLVTADVSTEADWTFVTPAVTLSQDFGEHSTGYQRFATAYRPGGFNTNLGPTNVRDVLLGQLQYDPEYIYSYEAGWKGRLWGISLAGAVYYSWTNEVQITTVPSALARGFVLDNAGDARVWGWEAEARRRWRLGPGRLDAHLALSGQKGEFDEGAAVLFDSNGDGVPDLTSLAGNEVPRMRDYQLVFNLAYRVPIAGRWEAVVSTSFQMADGGFETPLNNSSYEGYKLLDGRITVTNGAVRMSLFGRNLGDERYITNVLNTNEYYNEPRVLGVELGVEF